MRIVWIEVSGVRNLAEQRISFGTGFNLLTGANGQGKTSVLESIYLLGTTRSYRTSRLSELVGTGKLAARVAGEGDSPGDRLAVRIAARERSYLRHGKAVTASEYLGALDVVALSSELVQRFREKPMERRRFLDRMALATWPGYLDDLRNFRRANAQRAALAAAGGQGAQREAWDARTSALALPVARRRVEMAAALERQLREAPERIFPEGRGVCVKLISRPALESAETEAGQRYCAQLAEAFSRQPALAGRRETPAGPGRDDLAVEVEGRNLLRYGSSGQVRSLLAAATLGEMTRLKGMKGAFPALVLDDVESDLDEDRYGALLAALGGGAQVFAATSRSRLAHPMLRSDDPAARRFLVKDGVVAAA